MRSEISHQDSGPFIMLRSPCKDREAVSVCLHLQLGKLCHERWRYDAALESKGGDGPSFGEPPHRSRAKGDASPTTTVSMSMCNQAADIWRIRLASFKPLHQHTCNSTLRDRGPERIPFITDKITHLVAPVISLCISSSGADRVAQLTCRNAASLNQQLQLI